MAASSLYAIIVAGGSGSRMGSKTPKQFLALSGKPILMHTIEKFYNTNPAIQLIIVLPSSEMPIWEELCRQHSFTIAHETVAGGETRFQSVKNGLNAIKNTEGVVAIQDGVRPLTSSETILQSFKTAAEKGNAIAAVPSKDSLRMVQDDESKSVDRKHYYQIQTPQTFQLSIIKKAFELPESPLFTDDASVAEKAGHAIHLIEGSYENIKITTPEDLVIAEALLKSRR